MSQYFLSSIAEKDLNEIVIYLANKNKIAARKLLDSFHNVAHLLAANPLMGHIREDLTSYSVRFHTFEWHYLIVYKPTSPLEVVRVLSGYRDITNLLNNDA